MGRTMASSSWLLWELVRNSHTYSKGGMMPSSDQKVDHICAIPPLPQPCSGLHTHQDLDHIDLKEKYNKSSLVKTLPNHLLCTPFCIATTKNIWVTTMAWLFHSLLHF